jgi:excisionase family DNA binding protein
MLCIFVAWAHWVLSGLIVGSRESAGLPFANQLDTQTRQLPSLMLTGGGAMSSACEKTPFPRAENGGLPMLVDIQAVSRSFGISMRQVRRFVANGEIPIVRVGHLIRFDPEELNDWIDARRSGLHDLNPE